MTKKTSLTIYLLIAIVAIPILIEIFYEKHYQNAANSSNIDTTEWRVIDVLNIEWSDKLNIPAKLPTTTWSVRYEYVVDGIHYFGNNIDTDKTSFTSRSNYSANFFMILHSIKKIWYNPEDPKQSAVFIKDSPFYKNQKYYDMLYEYEYDEYKKIYENISNPPPFKPTW